MSVARHFGSGVMIGTPSGTNPTPVEFGVLQEIGLDFTFTSKPLTGQYQIPVAIGRGVAKITGKAKFAEMNGPVFTSLFFSGVTPAVGEDLWSYNEAGTVPTTPYQITVAQSATWSAELGVKFAATGAALTRVASAPVTGQYSVAAGVYTFAAADTAKAVLISYTYTQTVVGSKAIITNPIIGYSPTFQVDFYQQNPNVANTQWSFRLYSCLSTKLSIASKIDDWLIPEFDFEAFTDAANQLGIWNTAV